MEYKSFVSIQGLTRSGSAVSYGDYSAEPLFDEKFQHINVMKCNDAGYGVWQEKETRLFCHPSQEDWYSFPWSLVRMMMIRKAFSMSENETLEGFHLADDYYFRIHQ